MLKENPGSLSLISLELNSASFHILHEAEQLK
jgi:hypothetical protein